MATTNTGLINYTNPALVASAVPTTVPTAATYTASQTPGATNAVAATASQDQDKGTVAGQVRGLIAANDPLQQQAETYAKQQMAQRGGLNSSMAIGAAVDAQNRAALPIAMADAESTNRFALTNTGNQQQANLSNADAINKITLMNTESANQAAQFGAQQTNAMNTTQAQLSADNAKFNTAQQNTMVLNQMDQANKIELMNIQATFSGDVQASASSNALFNQTMDAISKIQASADIPAANKQANINQQVSLLKAGLNMNGSIAGLNLGALLSFTV